MPRTKGSKNKPTYEKVVTSKKQEANPFEIKSDLEFSGTRGATSPFIPLLVEQLTKLTAGDRRHSVNVPLTVCPVENAAVNLFLGLRRHLDATGGAISKMKFSSKKIYSLDKKKVYLGMRIWRIV